jgi:hypothetical protein
MSWCAETDQEQLGPGTVLSIFEQPWGPGLSVRPLPAGVSIAVRFPNGAVAKVDVISVSPPEAIIQTSNQDRWRMEEVAPKQVPLAASTGGAPTSYWIIRDRIVGQSTNTAPQSN